MDINEDWIFKKENEINSTIKLWINKLLQWCNYLVISNYHYKF